MCALKRGAVAQLGERRVRNALSSPPFLIHQALPWAGLRPNARQRTFVHVEVGQNWGKDLKPGRAEYPVSEPCECLRFSDQRTCSVAGGKKRPSQSAAASSLMRCVLFTLRSTCDWQRIATFRLAS